MLARGTEALSPWILVARTDHLHEQLIQEFRSLHNKTSFSFEPGDSSVEVRGSPEFHMELPELLFCQGILEMSGISRGDTKIKVSFLRSNHLFWLMQGVTAQQAREDHINKFFHSSYVV